MIGSLALLRSFGLKYMSTKFFTNKNGNTLSGQIVADGHLIATFDRDVNETTVMEIAKRHPNYFVMRDASAANDNVLDNFEQIFRHYSPATICKIL